MLQVQDLHVAYGHIQVVHGVSLRVEQGSIVALVGSNGAGKTTLLKTISGLLRPRDGAIFFEGERIDQLPPHRIVELGICHVPEGRRVFSRMTVVENLQMGAFLRDDAASVARDRDRVFDLFPRLKARVHQLAGTLSGGEQQMLAIGRALMARPRVLLLDEPSLGLAPLLVQAIFQVLEEVNRQGTTMLLVEQNAHMALGISHYGYVLQGGRVELQDEAKALRENPMVQQIYLGG